MKTLGPIGPRASRERVKIGRPIKLLYTEDISVVNKPMWKKRPHLQTIIHYNEDIKVQSDLNVLEIMMLNANI